MSMNSQVNHIFSIDISTHLFHFRTKYNVMLLEVKMLIVFDQSLSQVGQTLLQLEAILKATSPEQ